MKFLTIDGRLGKDAEQQVTPKNTEFITFSIANDTYIKGAIKTVWYDVVVFNADSIRSRLQYLKKGTYVAVTGIPDETPYVAKDGSLRINYSLLADRIEFLGGGKKDGDNNSQRATTQQVNEGFVHPVNAGAPQPQATYQQPIPQATYQAPVQQPMAQPVPQATYQQPAQPQPTPQPQITYQPQQPPVAPVTSALPGSDSGDDLPF